MDSFYGYLKLLKLQVDTALEEAERLVPDELWEENKNLFGQPVRYVPALARFNDLAVSLGEQIEHLEKR